jgi:CHAD domain-containing protein
VARLDTTPSVTELHRVRLLTKRARYAADATVPTFGRDARRFADALGGIQEVLGDMHDAVNAAHWLEGIAPGLEPAAAFAAGRTTEHLHRLAESHRTGWERSYARARRRSQWLG